MRNFVILIQCSHVNLKYTSTEKQIKWCWSNCGSHLGDASSRLGCNMSTNVLDKVKGYMSVSSSSQSQTVVAILTLEFTVGK